MNENVRALVFRSLQKTFQNRAFSNLESDSVLKNATLSPKDRAFYTALYLGVIEKKITIDYLLSRFCSLPFPELDENVKILLEMGVFQILFWDRVPDRAAIFESGELAKKKAPRAQGFVNAVLRKIAAEKETIPALLDFPGKKGLSLRYSYPKWLVSLWIDAYGKEKCEAILKAQNQKAALTLRVNTQRISQTELEDKFLQNGVAFHRNAVCEGALTIESKSDPTAIPGFAEGLFFVQDAAAQRAMAKLAVQKGDFVIDVCAAPGGKSFSAAIDAGPAGKVISLELHANRLELIRKGARQLGLSLETGENDSTLAIPRFENRADRVICDVPCSGYGVIAKKCDIRLKQPEDSAGLPEIQYKILAASAQYVKPGGKLLYATCTLNPQENEEISSAFLAGHPEFERCGEAETIFPRGGENDGFFADVLERKR